MADPGACLPPFEEALDELARATHPKALGAPGARLHVGLTGHFGARRVSPRDLNASLLGGLVALEGVVTKATVVRPKLARSVHYCDATGETVTREYRDAASHGGPPTGAAYPTHDDAGNVLTTEYGLCTYVDSQALTLQELPESAPPGQLPRGVDVICEYDLCDAAQPGDRVLITGVYKAVPPRAAGVISGVFHATLVACNVTKMAGGPGGAPVAAAAARVSVADLQAAEEIAARPDVLDLLASSLAPSIYGHALVKRGLIMQLLGGRERDLAGAGTRLRGDVHALLVGDPGVAKSQLLRAAMGVAPVAVSTTGRGASGVGLTAAVTSDRDTGERRLEAGAMVLADRGLVAIDEFDKMGDADRVAIHEVMEQQTVTIAKAGIHASLNARCSVLAAANPVYGSYDHGLSVARNVNLPDSLLSRFDLLFVLLDNGTRASDANIARHVLGQHRYRPPGDDGTSGGAGADAEADANEAADAAAAAAAAAGGGGTGDGVHVRYDERLYGPRVRGAPLPLTPAFLRKFIAVARARAAAAGGGAGLTMSGEAMEAIADFYVELRSAPDEDRALPVTVRTLETVIRLATAAAKARLSGDGVAVADVGVARHLMTHMLDGGAGEAAAAAAAKEAGKDGGGAGPPPPTGGGAGGRRKRGRGAAAADSSSSDDDSAGGSNDGAGGAGPAPSGRGGGPSAPPSTAGTRRTRARAASPSAVTTTQDGDASALTEAQVTAIGLAVREALLDRAGGEGGGHSVSALLARLRTRGLRYGRPAVVAALAELERRHGEAPGSAGAVAPIMFDTGADAFYEA